MNEHEIEDCRRMGAGAVDLKTFNALCDTALKAVTSMQIENLREDRDHVIAVLKKCWRMDREL